MRIYNDSPMPLKLGFQDGASENYYVMIELYNAIIFYLIVIGILIIWVLIRIIKQSKVIGNQYIHLYKAASRIEIIWTITPAIILIAIAIPSIKILYLNEQRDIDYITIKVIGNQWYWRYEYSSTIGYDSFMIPTEELEVGQLRLLEVDNPIVLPIVTQIKSLITSADVIHSFSVPSLGIKVDAIPGRVNSVNYTILREGNYYGQCYENCGSAHSMMPIVIKGKNISEFITWIKGV